jgi:hypothetical protein
MKVFFQLMMLTAVVSVVCEFVICLPATAHHRSEGRYELLHTTNSQQEQSNAGYGLAQKELSACDERVANAYRVAVFEEYRLKRGFDLLALQSFVLSAALFVTGVVGLRSLRQWVKPSSSIA